MTLNIKLYLLRKCIPIKQKKSFKLNFEKFWTINLILENPFKIIWKWIYLISIQNNPLNKSKK